MGSHARCRPHMDKHATYNADAVALPQHHFATMMGGSSVMRAPWAAAARAHPRARAGRPREWLPGERAAAGSPGFWRLRHPLGCIHNCAAGCMDEISWPLPFVSYHTKDITQVITSMQFYQSGGLP